VLAYLLPIDGIQAHTKLNIYEFKQSDFKLLKKLTDQKFYGVFAKSVFSGVSVLLQGWVGEWEENLVGVVKEK